jgi:GDP-4-dehydro-6-deoxy-D-mannose reductase
MPRRFLLTGASGFVGSYLTAALRERYPSADISRVGARIAGASLPSDIVSVDILDADAMIEAVRACEPDVVVHLAAQSSAARSDATANLTWSVNLSGSLNLALAIARHAPCATVLFASTAEVYGASFLGGPVSETTTLFPLNAYAKSKVLAERMFSDVLPSTARLIVARPFNHTGPGQQEHFVLPSFAAQVARLEVGLQEPRVSVGNIDVCRDFLDVRDVVTAYLALVDRAPNLPSRFTVNIASGHPLLLRDLLETLQQLANVSFEIDVDPSRLRAVDLPVAYAEPRLLQTVTEWRPEIPITQTLSDLLGSARTKLLST